MNTTKKSTGAKRAVDKAESIFNFRFSALKLFRISIFVLSASLLAVPPAVSAATIIASDKPAFQADLTTTLKLQAGTGNPTFTRATTAYQTDFEGKLNAVLSGEARFQGARRVQNLFGGSSEDLTNSHWGANNTGSVTATTMTFTTAGNDGWNNSDLTSSPVPSGHIVVFSATMWTNSGTKNVRFRAGGTLTPNILINTIPTRYSAVIISTGASQHGVFNGGDLVAGTINVTKMQLEDVTGQTNQNPSEYVSVGVLAAPYHGAGVDGVQYFNTLNGNTVASNVVTAGTGAVINSTTAKFAQGAPAATDNFTTPNTTSVDVGSGPIEVIVKVAMNDYNASTGNMIVDSEAPSATTNGYNLRVYGNILRWGTASAGVNSSVHGVANGVASWFKVTSTGSGGTLTFYKSPDGATWTQISQTTDVTRTSTIYNLSIGTQNNGGNTGTDGKIYYVSIAKSIGGTPSVVFNPNTFSSGTTWASAATGETWTVNGNAKVFGGSGTSSISAPWDSTGPLGYLAEGARTNYFTYSDDFANASSIWKALNISVSSNVTTAPDGSQTADALIPDTANVYYHRLYWDFSNYNLGANSMSFYVKPAGYAFFKIITDNGALIPLNDNFYLDDGTTTGGHGSIVSAGQGWYRITLNFTASGSTRIGIYVFDSRAHLDAPWGSNPYVGDGVSGVYLWGAQLEHASFASSYIPTTTGSATRNADVLKYQSSGNVSISNGSLSIEYQAGAVGAFIPFALDAGGNYIDSAVTATSMAWIVSAVHGTTVTGLTDITTGVRKRAFTWGPSTTSATGDGLPPTVGDAFGISSISAIGIGGLVNDTSDNLFGTIRNVKIWKKALTNTQLTAMTSTNTAVARAAVPQTSTVVASLNPGFQADLTTTLKLQAGTGNPTFTRATTAYQTDFEGKLNQAISGEARFQGARRVQNMLVSTEDWSSGSWLNSGTCTVTANTAIAPNGTLTADTVSPGGGSQRLQFVALTAGHTYVWSFYVKGTGTFYAKTYDGVSDSNGTLLTSSPTSWTRVTHTFTSVTSATNNVAILSNGAFDFYVWGAQVEDVTGQTNQNPSEYVSTGVNPAPYHGANVDGVQYFSTLNGNTVASNVVTAGTGAAINSSTSKFGQLPGVSGSYFSTPDSAASSITGDIDIRVKAAMPDWTPAAAMMFISKDNGTNLTASRSYDFALLTNGGLSTEWNLDGSSVGITVQSTASVSFSDGTVGWVRVTRQSSSGDVKFYTSSDDGVSWVQLGTTRSSTAGALYDNAIPVMVGQANQGGANLLGTIYRAQAFNTIGGTTPVVDFNPNTWSSGTTWNSTATGETWTINGNASVFAGTGLWDATGPLGYLAEGARTNLALQSQTFDNVAWTEEGSRATISANTAIAPDGTVTADSLLETVANVEHNMYQPFGKAASAITYTWGVSIKPNGRSWVQLVLYDQTLTVGVRQWFNVSTGAIGSSQAIGSGWAVTPNIKAEANGFYRVSITGTTNTSTTLNVYVMPATGDLVDAYAGDVTKGLYMWGAQLEAAAFASSYIPTTTGSATRNADVLNYPTNGNVSATVGTAYFEPMTTVTGNSLGEREPLIINSTGPQFFIGNGASVFSMKDVADSVRLGSPVYTGSFIVAANTLYKAAGSWLVGGNYDWVVNGTDYGGGAQTATPSLTTIDVGNSSGGSQLFGTIRNVKIWKKALTSLQLTNMTSTNAAVARAAVPKVTTVNASTNTSGGSLTSGLVGLWSFDGKDMLWASSTAGTALDRSGQGNNGTLTNMSQSTSPTIGKIGQALKFASVTSYVNVGSHASLSFPNQSFSVSSWIKFNTIPAADINDIGIVADYRDTNANWLLYKARNAGGVFGFGLDTNGTWALERKATGTTIPVVNKWYHIVGVYNNSTGDTSIYINGISENTAAGSPVTIGAVNDVTIGNWYSLDGNGGSIGPNGTIDDVRMYNRALSATEVKALYNLGR